jgi:hypothetical protein
VSNLKHRPIGIGYRAWRTCSPRRGAFDSEEAFEMERGIFRVIYHAADGVRPAGGRVRAYESHDGSPCRRASFSPTCGATTRVGCDVTLEDWDDLRKMVAEHGARNSLLSPSCRRRRRPSWIRGGRWSHATYCLPARRWRGVHRRQPRAGARAEARGTSRSRRRSS